MRTSSTGRTGSASGGLAWAFARELVGTTRAEHPDIYPLEPLGEMIRIDEIRTLHRDLHMRPFEADRRVYLIFSADLMNDDATAALLKDLEEPPPYAVIVLVADNLGPIAGRSVRAASSCRSAGCPSAQCATPSSAHARVRRAGSRPRSPASLRDGSTGSSGCSTATPPLAGRC